MWLQKYNNNLHLQIFYKKKRLSKRKTLIGDVIVRVDPTFALDFHVDTDEANGAWLSSGDKVKIVR